MPWDGRAALQKIPQRADWPAAGGSFLHLHATAAPCHHERWSLDRHAARHACLRFATVCHLGASRACAVAVCPPFRRQAFVFPACRLRARLLRISYQLRRQARPYACGPCRPAMGGPEPKVPTVRASSQVPILLNWTISLPGAKWFSLNVKLFLKICNSPINTGSGKKKKRQPSFHLLTELLRLLG
jgi:hypothetical protein